MSAPTVALVDGPLAPDRPARAPAARHAAAMAAAIAAHAPAARIVGVVLFDDRLAASAARAARALAEAAATDAAIVHCSFGLARADDAVAAAAAALLAGGRLVVAAAPARGGPVWPAALPGVIAVQGDARCGPDDWSWLDLPGAAFGACPSLAAHPEVAGASVAAARVTGMIAARLAAGADPAAALAALRAEARFRGRERRAAP